MASPKQSISINRVGSAVSNLNDAVRRRHDDNRCASHLIAEIDQGAIRHNCGVLRARLPARCQFCVAVKANAYGHGLELVLPTLGDLDVDMVAVATVTEARQARDLGWNRPALLMGTELSIYQGSLKRDVAAWLVQSEIRVTVLSLDDLKALADVAAAIGKPALIHLKLDTGLSRMGVDETTLINLIEHADKMPGVVIDGLYTHFASSDEPGCAFANEQLKRFLRFAARLRESGRTMPTIHAANSAAIVNMPDSCLDMVRPGIGVYGYQTICDNEARLDLKPTMRVVSFIMLVKRVPAGSDVGYGRSFTTRRDSVLGIIPVGYADGLDRRLSNSGYVTVEGCLAPIVGKISMDQTIVDLTEIVRDRNVQAGCRAIVIDSDPTAPNSVEQLAKTLDTIPYEIVTSISPRVVRVAKPRI